MDYYSFNRISPTTELEIVNNLPVIGPDGAEVKKILHLFEQFHKLCRKNTYGSTVIRSSFLRQIELLYNRFAKSKKATYRFDSFPLSRKASLYIAAHSTAPLTISDVVKAVCPTTTEASLNHALLVATGLNFNQYLNRLRLAHAMTYFLYDSFSFDYISSISGFNEEITFFRRFKTMTGMTPQTYLNQMISDGRDGRIYRGTIMSETLIAAISYLYENMTEPIEIQTKFQL